MNILRLPGLDVPDVDVPVRVPADHQVGLAGDRVDGRDGCLSGDTGPVPDSVAYRIGVLQNMFYF